MLGLCSKVVSSVWSSIMTKKPFRAYRRITQKNRAMVESVGRYLQMAALMCSQFAARSK